MKKYYQDELSYLREMGREFVAAHPEAAPFLAEGGADPDVERLLEGFAFLTARIRHKLEDEFPELTHGIMAMFWPHYLRPIPAMTIVQFEALPQARRDLRRIARGSALDSQPVDGTRCRFRTSYEVTLTPFALEEVELKQGTSATLRLRLRLPEGVRLDQLGLDALRLFLNGDAAARSLAVCLCRYTRRVVVRAGPGGGERSFEPSVVRPVGLTAAELLLPAPAVSPEGYRILHEYLAFPEKCRFVDLLRVDQWSALKGAQYFDVIFDLARIPDDTPPVDATSILLHCTPAINLFPHDADAIRITHDRTEYLLRPAAAAGSHYEVYSVDRVSGLVLGTAKPREYRPLYGFAHSLPPGDDLYYSTRLAPAPAGDGTQMLITLATPPAQAGALEIETVSAELTCTNRQLPSTLRVGDVQLTTDSSPEFARFRNVTRPTMSVPPPLGGSVYWRLLSHMSLNYRSIGSVDMLRNALELYNFRALVDRQAAQAHKRLLDAIKSISTQAKTLLHRGAPVRGVAIALELDEAGFSGEGDLYVFAAVLNEFFASYVTVNAFSQLTVTGSRYKEVHAWPLKLGGKSSL